MGSFQTTPSDRHSCNHSILPTFRHGMHSYKAKANPVSSYIQLSSLAMFSFAIGQNAVLMNVNRGIAI